MFKIKAMLVKGNLWVNTPNVEFSIGHVLLSVSLCSNVARYEWPKCFVVLSVATECVDRFMCRANTIAEVAKHAMISAYADILRCRQSAIERSKMADKWFTDTALLNARVYRQRTDFNGLLKELPTCT